MKIYGFFSTGIGIFSALKELHSKKKKIYNNNVYHSVSSSYEAPVLAIRYYIITWTTY